MPLIHICMLSPASLCRARPEYCPLLHPVASPDLTSLLTCHFYIQGCFSKTTSEVLSKGRSHLDFTEHVLSAELCALGHTNDIAPQTGPHCQEDLGQLPNLAEPQYCSPLRLITIFIPVLRCVKNVNYINSTFRNENGL